MQLKKEYVEGSLYFEMPPLKTEKSEIRFQLKRLEKPN